MTWNIGCSLKLTRLHGQRIAQGVTGVVILLDWILVFVVQVFLLWIGVSLEFVNQILALLRDTEPVCFEELADGVNTILNRVLVFYDSPDVYLAISESLLS